jgi:hypothetical protein
VASLVVTAPSGDVPAGPRRSTAPRCGFPTLSCRPAGLPPRPLRHRAASGPESPSAARCAHGRSPRTTSCRLARPPHPTEVERHGRARLGLAGLSTATAFHCATSGPRSVCRAASSSRSLEATCRSARFPLPRRSAPPGHEVPDTPVQPSTAARSPPLRAETRSASESASGRSLGRQAGVLLRALPHRSATGQPEAPLPAGPADLDHRAPAAAHAEACAPSRAVAAAPQQRRGHLTLKLPARRNVRPAPGSAPAPAPRSRLPCPTCRAGRSPSVRRFQTAVPPGDEPPPPAPAPRRNETLLPGSAVRRLRDRVVLRPPGPATSSAGQPARLAGRSPSARWRATHAPRGDTALQACRAAAPKRGLGACLGCRANRAGLGDPTCTGRRAEARRSCVAGSPLCWGNEVRPAWSSPAAEAAGRASLAFPRRSWDDLGAPFVTDPWTEVQVLATGPDRSPGSLRRVRRSLRRRLEPVIPAPGAPKRTVDVDPALVPVCGPRRLPDQQVRGTEVLRAADPWPPYPRSTCGRPPCRPPVPKHQWAIRRGPPASLATSLEHFFTSRGAPQRTEQVKRFHRSRGRRFGLSGVHPPSCRGTGAVAPRPFTSRSVGFPRRAPTFPSILRCQRNRVRRRTHGLRVGAAGWRGAPKRLATDRWPARLSFDPGGSVPSRPQRRSAVVPNVRGRRFRERRARAGLASAHRSASRPGPARVRRPSGEPWRCPRPSQPAGRSPRTVVARWSPHGPAGGALTRPRPCCARAQWLP